jgi:hypothetical protein
MGGLMRKSGLIPMPPPTEVGSVSPSDVPIAFQLELTNGHRRPELTIYFVYSAGVDEPLQHRTASLVTFAYGVHSSRLFRATFDLRTAPADDTAFWPWLSHEFKSALAVLLKDARSGPRKNYELASQGFRDDMPPPWMVSALQEMRASRDSWRSR